MSRDPDDELRAIPLGFRRRTLGTLRMAASLGVGALKRTVGNGNGAEPGDTSEAVAAAKRLVAELGKRKGLVMKVGQLASYLPGSWPAEARQALAALQRDAQAMAPDLVEEVFAKEIGQRPSDVFEHFEPVPFAAASIGQVHRARLDGRDLAVKIQYPGVDEAIESDLSTVGLLLRVGSLGTALDGADVAKELAESLREECDYLNEAKNQILFADLLRNVEGSRVPAVVGRLTARRVLTTELVRGQDFQTFKASASQEAKDRAARIIFEMNFGCLFRYGVLNGDPHPGNYIFHPEDGTVTFLDFGCVRYLDRPFVDTWKALARCLLDGDRDRFPERLIAAGLAPDRGRYDWDYAWSMMRHLYEPYLAREFTFTESYVRSSYERMLFKNPNRVKTPMPGPWLYTNRLQWGLNSVLSALDATGPWARLFRDGVESPTEIRRPPDGVVGPGSI